MDVACTEGGYVYWGLTPHHQPGYRGGLCLLGVNASPPARVPRGVMFIGG